MKRLWIILLLSFLWAICLKNEGKGFTRYDLFLFADWTVTWPGYLVNLCLNFVLIAPMWVFVSLETEKPKEVKWAAWIISGRGIDFVLEANKTWVKIDLPIIGVCPIYYDTLMFSLLFLVVIKATFNE